MFYSVEIKSAFSQGTGIDCDVHLKLPKEAEVYGLCDGPRIWYISVKDVLLKTGSEKSKFDD